MAENLRKTFEPLEDQRNAISPIRVLHEAVGLSGICNIGPVLPLMSGLNEGQLTTLRGVVQQLQKA